MPELLLELLQELESIAEEHEEIYDTDACEKMGITIGNLFIDPVDKYEYSDDFGLYKENGNSRVKQALKTYINEANKISLGSAMSLEERLDTFQDKNVMTENGSQYDDFFGWVDPSEFDPDSLIHWSIPEEEKLLYFLCYQLLECLESISINNPEIFTSVCREKMSDLIWSTFITPNAKYKLPDNFGFSSEIVDREVKQLLQSYVTEVSKIACSLSFSFHQRLFVFQDTYYTTYPTEKRFDDFFNRRDPDGFDAVGKWFGVDKTTKTVENREIEDREIDPYRVPEEQLSLFDF